MYLPAIRSRFSFSKLYRRWSRKPVVAQEVSVKDLFGFRGVVFGRGRMAVPDDETPQRFLCFNTRRVFPLQFEPDPHVPWGKSVRSFSFSFKPPFAFLPSELAAASLVFEFESFLCEVSGIAEKVLATDAFAKTGSSFWKAIEACTTPSVLEIRSRARSGVVRKDLFGPNTRYVGLDIKEGPNVDMVGDAHALSTLFPPDTFDFAFSVSVWEHLKAPWLAAAELNKVLKLGGMALINSHQAWPYHEGPWDYFRFSESAWEALFNEATGFEIVEVGMGQRCSLVPSSYFADSSESGIEWEYGFLASRCVVKKISNTNQTWALPRLRSEGVQYPG